MIDNIHYINFLTIYEEPLHYHYSPVQSDPDSKKYVRDPSLGQIEQQLFTKFSLLVSLFNGTSTFMI